MTTTQAGADVTCSCGNTLPVPTLLKLKQLPQVREDESKRAAANWTPLQGGVFVAGASIALISLGVVAYLAWERSKLDTRKPKVRSKEQFIEDSHKRDVDYLWKAWDALSDKQAWPRHRHRIPKYAVHRETDRRLRSRQFVALGFTAAGVAISAASFFLRFPSRPQRRRKRPPHKD